MKQAAPSKGGLFNSMPMSLSDLLAAVAILVSVAALLMNRKTQKRQLQMENRLLEIEEASERARIAQTFRENVVTYCH